MIKVGVIGLGAMGGNHVRFYSELPDVEPVGITDTDHGMTQGLAKKYRTMPFSDYKENDSYLVKELSVPFGEPLKLELEAFIHSLKNNIHHQSPERTA